MLSERVSAGIGIYTLPEAAKYARISPVTLSRWLKGSTAGERVIPNQNTDTRIVDFVEFVQALAVRNLRLHYGISLQKIRDAVERAETDYGVRHPFARQHTCYVFEHQLWITLEGQTFIQVSGRNHGQSAMTPVIARFLVDVSFDPETGLANQYKAYERGSHKIVMNPKLRFGEPILDDCGYTPEALFQAAKTEGSAERAALIYGVSKEQVDVCIDYFDYLQAA